MNHTLTDSPLVFQLTTELEKKLCDDLSELFVIGRIHYDWIAQNVSKYELDYIEYVLLNLVGPVLWLEHYITTPEVWGYDAEWLWSEVQKNRRNEENPNFVKRILLSIRKYFIKYTVKEEWDRLKIEIVAYKKSSPI